MQDAFVLLLHTRDRRLRAGLEILTREQGGRLCTPEDLGGETPCCMLTDLDGEPGTLPEGVPEDLPKYTVSYFEEKHPTLLRPFSEERFAALLGAMMAGADRISGAGFTAPETERPADLLLFDGRSLFLSGRKLSLSEKERQVFTLLYKADGKPVAAETIAREVWGRADAVNNVRVYIRYLRRKIAAVSDRNYIKTLRDGGFFLQRNREK